MEDTFLVGDKIVVSKLNYGPKLPGGLEDIPWINILFSHFTDSKAKNNGKYLRLNGYSKIKKGEVVVFKTHNEHHETIVKRCAAVEGDTITIVNGIIYINGELGTMVEKIRRNYVLKVHDFSFFDRIADSLGLHHILSSVELGSRLIANLSDKEVETLSCRGVIDSIEFYSSSDPAFTGKSMSWSIDNLGPLIIPHKGWTIDLNDKTYLIYKQAIAQEVESVTKKESRFYINKRQAYRYQFRQNYYFVLGDNRPNSNDSRYSGLVPESLIEGRVICVLFGKTNKGDFTFFKLP